MTTGHEPTTQPARSSVPALALSADEAAEAIGISARKLWELGASGNGPPRIKLGRRTLYPTDLLAAWLREQAEGGSNG